METTMMAMGNNYAEFGYHLKFLTTYYRPMGVCFRNIRVSKMSSFAYFELDSHFQGYLLQKLDDQIQCEHFGENLRNGG